MTKSDIISNYVNCTNYIEMKKEEETRGIEFVKNKLKVFGCGAC